MFPNAFTELQRRDYTRKCLLCSIIEHGSMSRVAMLSITGITDQDIQVLIDGKYLQPNTEKTRYRASKRGILASLRLECDCCGSEGALETDSDKTRYWVECSAGDCFCTTELKELAGEQYSDWANKLIALPKPMIQVSPQDFEEASNV